MVEVEAGELLSNRVAEVSLGDEVTIEFLVDVADEAHLHAYDIKLDLTPGVRAEMVFQATIAGIFELELEGSHQQVLELTVTP